MIAQPVNGETVNSKSISPRIIFAGGGTGGHIYPALAMADAVKKFNPDSRIDFVGTPSGLESKLVPRAGYPLHFITVGRLHRSVGVFERIKTLIMMPLAMIKSFYLIFKLRPTAVVGVGGYASGPIVLAAALMRIRTIIWEPNAYPGLANRILARFVDHCLVVFNEAAGILKNKNVTRVHMPVRREIEELTPNVIAGNELHLLVFGGSQGSRALNNVLLESVKIGGEWLHDVKIVHQAGALDFARLKNDYAAIAGIREFLEVHEYLHDMPSRLKWADVVVARSGTGTISELAACAKAAILVPLPTAADDHQTKNAQALVKMNAAIMIPQREFTAERLMNEISEIKNHREKLRELAHNVQSFHRKQAADEIAKLLLADA